MSERIKAFGTEFQRKTNTDTFETIGGVTDIGGPALEADSIDVTAHDSEDGFREHLQGLKDAGELSLELRFDPADDKHKDLLQDYVDGDNHSYKLVFPDSDTTSWEFEGHITGFEPSAAFEDDLTASVTIKLSGKPNLALNS